MPTKQDYIEKAESEYGKPLSDFIESVASDWSMRNTKVRYHDTKDYMKWLVDKGILPDTDDPKFTQTSTVKKYLDWCKVSQGLADATVNNRRNSIKKFYDYVLMDSSDPSEHPFKTAQGDVVDALKAGKYAPKQTERQKQVEDSEDIPRLTDSQVDQLLESVPGPKLRNRLIIRLALNTGLRLNEIRHVKLSHLNINDPDDRTIRVTHGKGANGSGPKERFVVYPSELNFPLRQYVKGGYREESDYSDSEYLFLTYQSPQITKNAIHKMLRRTAERAGLTEPQWIDASGGVHYPVHPHVLRHTYIFNYVEKVPPRLLMEFTGHEDLELILRYSEMNDEEIITQGMKHIK